MNNMGPDKNECSPVHSAGQKSWGPWARLAVALACAILAGCLYVPAEAKALVRSHNYPAGVLHPWGNVLVTFFILMFCVRCGILSIQVIRRGTRWQRAVACILIVCPAFILGRFLCDAVRLVEWSIGELTYDG